MSNAQRGRADDNAGDAEAPAHVRAPFTPEQVASLNAYQASCAFHPFTCAVNSRHGALRSTPSGWRCEVCGYEQDWAHPWMADGSWARRATPGGDRTSSDA